MSALLRTEAGERALVVVPTFNEVLSIAEVARRLFDADDDRVELLVVDDASPDGTADVARQLAEGPHEMHVMQRSRKLGLGSAYIDGFRWGLERGYSAFVEMDADLSHDPADVPRLLDALETSDLAIGSRYVPGGRIENWGPLRKALSRAGNVYARALLGFDVHDSTSGFRAYRPGALRGIDFNSIRSEGYAFQIEMTRRVHRNGGTIVEIPITFVERVHGHSKLSRRIVVEALARVTGWGVRDRLGRKPSS